MPIFPVNNSNFLRKQNLNSISINKDINASNETFSCDCNDLNKYPYAVFLLNTCVSSARKRKKGHLPSELRFFELINDGKSIQDGHFEDFLRGKQKIAPESYFIQMKYYKKDNFWAKEMEGLTYFVSNLISCGLDFDNILENASLGIHYINQNKSDSYGLLKSDNQNMVVAFGYSVEKNKRGEEYYEKYKEKIKRSFYPKVPCEYRENVNCSYVTYESDTDSFLVQYPYYASLDNTNLEIAKDIYEELKSIKNPSKKQVVQAMAKIQWLIAQETPYVKGSDSVANLITRSIAHAYNLPVSPLKKGISLDFEAWYQNMDKYVKNYPDYFEKNLLR